MVYLLCKYGKRTTSEPEKSLRQLTAILMSCLFQRSSYFRPNHLWSQRYYQATATSYHQMRSHFFWTLSKWTKTISNPSWMLRSIKTMIKWNKIGFQSKNVTNWIAKIKFMERKNSKLNRKTVLLFPWWIYSFYFQRVVLTVSYTLNEHI